MCSCQDTDPEGTAEETKRVRRKAVSVVKRKVQRQRTAKHPIPFPVVITKGFHLFPSRTQKLSPSVPKVLGWRRPGRIGRCRIPIQKLERASFFIFLSVVDSWVRQPYNTFASNGRENRLCFSSLKTKGFFIFTMTRYLLFLLFSRQGRA